MKELIASYCSIIENHLKKIESILRIKNRINKSIDVLDKQYARGDFTYKRYSAIKNQLLQNKGKKEFFQWLDSYIVKLVEDSQSLNSKMVDIMAHDEDRQSDNLSISINPGSDENGHIRRKVISDISSNEKRLPKPDSFFGRGGFSSKMIKEKALFEMDKNISEKIFSLDSKKNVVDDDKVKGIDTKEKEILSDGIHIENDVFEGRKKIDMIKDEMSDRNRYPGRRVRSDPVSDRSNKNILEKTGVRKQSTVVRAEKKDNENAVKADRLDFLTDDGRGQVEENGANKEDVPEMDLTSDISKEMKDIPLPHKKAKLNVPRPKKIPFSKRLAYDFQSVEKPIEEKYFGKSNVKGILSKEVMEAIAGDNKEQEFHTGETRILPSIFTYESKQGDIDDQYDEGKLEILDPYLLEKEIKEIKSFMTKNRAKIYRPSQIGHLANYTVRKISIYFIEKFPDFFRKLYVALRYANIKVLSNTYINVMFLMSLISFFVLIPLISVFFAMQGTSTMAQAVFKTIVISFFASFFLFLGFYYYPFEKLKKRKRSINTNLPFAIDHISSVISSGVPPATMFKLISSSKEYGDISVEMAKVSNYIEVFGYDMLTAIRAVSTTTPSHMFKEFLDGLVSTIETGGDLKRYLSQKSKEAMMNYRLERQKYVESLSTYSDLYTGVLIAAPLFFVTALSLVGMLGGAVGGLDVNLIITVGTYAVIPLLNVFFIIFLELNQPDI